MSAATWGTRVLLVLAAVAFSLLLVEGALRVLGLFPPRSPYHSQFVEYDAARGWRNVPGASGHYTTDEFHVALDYNARAYRGPLHAYEKPAGVFRVLVLGDSFVEGFTVPREARVSEILERLMSTDGRRVEVIALGTSGYGTDQQLLWLIDEGLRYAPDVVVHMFYYNDVFHNLQSDYSYGAKPRYIAAGDSLTLTNVPVPAPERPLTGEQRSGSAMRRFAVWLAEHSRVMSLATRATKASPALQRFATRLGLAERPQGDAIAAGDASALPEEFVVFRPQPTPVVDSAWQLTERLVGEMDRRSRDAGARFIAFHIPFRFAVQRERERDPLAHAALDLTIVGRRFQTMCDRLAIECIEPTNDYAVAADTLRDDGIRLYFSYDWHWRAAGHALAARLLADAIAGEPLNPARTPRASSPAPATAAAPRGG